MLLVTPPPTVLPIESSTKTSKSLSAPPVPGFYAGPQNIDDIVDHSVGRVLDLFGLDGGKVHRWRETPARDHLQVRKGGRDETA